MIPRIFNFICFFIVISGLFAAHSHAQTNTQDQKYVAVNAYPSVYTIQGGQSFYIAIEKQIHDGWHTYWSNPGDSGAAMRVNWDAPEGFAFDYLWPTPKAIPYGPLMNFGYEGTATILTEVATPDPLPEGPITISGQIEVLVCEEICIPEFHEISLTLNDGSEGNNEDRISAALDQIPVEINWPATYQSLENDSRLQVVVDAQSMGWFGRGSQFQFELFPYEWGVIENTASTKVRAEALQTQENRLFLSKERGSRDITDLGELRFVLVGSANGGPEQAIEFTALPDKEWLENASAKETPAIATPVEFPEFNVAEAALSTLPVALLFAFIGGLILNLMPCVFPVLSLKVLKISKMADADHKALKFHGIAYTLGILVCFGIIGLLLALMKGAGAQIGWGFHLQSPMLVLILSFLLFLIGLNLSGLFDVSLSAGNKGQKLAARDNLLGSFMTGVLATLVATPCTAPFMGSALGYGLTQSASAAILVFLFLGLGLAFPYLLISFVPALSKRMPRPGIWMEHLKQFLAFPMYASAAWLLWVYSLQTSSEALFFAMIGMVGLACAIWILKHTPDDKLSKSKSALFFVIIAYIILFSSLWGAFSHSRMSVQALPETDQSAEQDSPLAYVPYSHEALQEALSTDRPVFVNMTAAWCITCKVNERIALHVPSTIKLFQDKNIAYIKGDWTNRNAEITSFLENYGRNGVPIYVYYGAPGAHGKRPEALVLPQILTPSIVEEYLIK